MGIKPYLQLPTNLDIVSPVLQVDGTDIECINDFKYLDTTIYKFINLHNRANKITNKISKTNGIVIKDIIYNVQFSHSFAHKAFY